MKIRYYRDRDPLFDHFLYKHECGKWFYTSTKWEIKEWLDMDTDSPFFTPEDKELTEQEVFVEIL